MTTKIIEKKSKIKSSGFYTPLEASRISQVPLWTVHDWRRKGIVLPTIEWIDETSKSHIGHNFETVVFLRLIKYLREKGISLLQSVTTINKLNIRLGSPSKRWANAKIFVCEKDIIVHDMTDGYGSTIVNKNHQVIWEVFFGDDFKRLKERADALLIPEIYMNHVEIDLNIQNGLPILKNTTMLTSTIHELSKSGYAPKDIHDLYPFIALNKIKGAEEYELFLDRVGKN